MEKPANCRPSPTVVALKEYNPTYIHRPSCTRVDRCGGCCNLQRQSCEPTETKTVNFVVDRYCYEGAKTKRCGFDLVPIETHLKCKCNCRIKPEDCNSNQFHHDCRCFCKNKDDEKQCIANEDKIWDEKSCGCVCKYLLNCTTGTYFDETQCKCVVDAPIDVNENA